MTTLGTRPAVHTPPSRSWWRKKRWWLIALFVVVAGVAAANKADDQKPTATPEPSAVDTSTPVPSATVEAGFPYAQQCGLESADVVNRHDLYLYGTLKTADQWVKYMVPFGYSGPLLDDITSPYAYVSPPGGLAAKLTCNADGTFTLDRDTPTGP